MKNPVKNLITWSPSYLITSRKSAFTLAEILITLAIIGVVAAMTIPTLTANYQKNLITSRMLKFYSSMKQAVQLASVDGLTENITYEKSGEKILEWYNML